LPVVLYGCESWSLTLREEFRLRVFENKVLRRIFGSKRDEVTGEWRKLHNEEFYVLYSSPNIIQVITSRSLRLAGHIACMGRGEAYTRRRSLRRPRILLKWISDVEWGHGLDRSG
jgi:hypothetical protein